MLENLLTPAILFFALGFLATWVHSDLEIPQPISKTIAFYLLIGIGIKGGAQIAAQPLNGAAIAVIGTAIAMSALVPLGIFLLLRGPFRRADRAAIAATYGSVSAVTFVAAIQFLELRGVPFGGYMVAAMALMEAPAIVVALWLFRRGGSADPGDHSPWEALTNGSVLLLIGSLGIGFLSRPQALEAVRPFTEGLFQGVLLLFLLDMGIVASRRVGALRRAGPGAVAAAILIPLAAGSIAIGASISFAFPLGDAFLLTVLSASASYIAVPAALRVAIPEADAGLYVPMALALTFPFNLLLGLPLYFSLLERVL